ncbi:MAG: S8 family serine peptidase [Desulfurivibrionaceae bacterium]
MTVHPRYLLSVIMAILLLAGPVAGRSATVDGELRARLNSVAAGTKVPVIVSFADGISPSAFRGVSSRQDRNALVGAMRRKAEQAQGPVKDFLGKRGVGRIDSLWIINAIALEAEPELIETLTLRPGIEEIRLNGTVTAPEVVAQQVAGKPEWNIAAVGADLLWERGLTGEGVVVATLDSGVDGYHPDLQSKWRGWTGAPCDPETSAGTRDWFDPHGEHPNCPSDGVGHGTNVMGIMVGGRAGGTSIGVAPDAAWIAAKIFDDAGNSTYAAIHSAFQWVLDPDGDGDTGDAPDIVGNSWGLNEAMNSCLNEFQPDIELLKAAGIAVLFSAGNTGPERSTSISPANYPESIGVGSTDRFGGVADFSARGPSPCGAGDSIYPDLTAPGDHVLTTDLTEGGANPDSYVITFGTSISVPHIGGIMALLLETDGFPLTPISELETTLRLSATDLGLEGPDNNYGYGQVNGLAAYKRLAGQPYLGVYDPKPPENDLTLDFGSIPVGLEVVHTIAIRNSGGGQLMPNILAEPEQPFSVVSDTCSGAVLASADSCRIDLRFSPADADITYNGNLTISSNDTDRSSAVISLAGTGNSNPLPPEIEFSAAGQTLDFGSVAPGSTAQKSLTITNVGVQFLVIEPLDSSLLPARFEVVDDQCGGKSLAGGASCEIVFSFRPAATKTYQGSVEIISNDPVQASATISLAGIGNNPPARATLVSPPNGATDLALPVTVQWFHPSDPDGDPVTDTVVVSELSPGTAGAGTINRMTLTAAAMPVHASILLLLAALLVLGCSGKTRRSAYFVILAGGILLLNSCGGGSDAPARPAAISDSLTETELKSGTTYIWKVVSEDGKGGVSESASWTFTTR